MVSERKRKITIRLSEKEITQIDELAKSQNKSREQFIRDSMFNENLTNPTKALAIATRLILINQELDHIYDTELKDHVRKETDELWRQLSL